MTRNLVFALLSFAPLALGGVALADDDHHGNHEEHEEHEHRRAVPYFGVTPVQPYATPPGYYNAAPEDSDRYVPEDSDRPYGYQPYGNGYYGPYNQPLPPRDDDDRY